MKIGMRRGQQSRDNQAYLKVHNNNSWRDVSKSWKHLSSKTCHIHVAVVIECIRAAGQGENRGDVEGRMEGENYLRLAYYYFPYCRPYII